MQTRFSKEYLHTPDGKRVEELLRACVHCGFCNATCPTFQLTGDELDGPRGRIYLIQNMLEGQPVSRTTQIHLDRCLSCLGCESTCPSGVRYGELLDHGRRHIESLHLRSPSEKGLRWALRTLISSPRYFSPVWKMALTLRRFLPSNLRSVKLKPLFNINKTKPTLKTARRHVLLLNGCVQSVAAPHVNQHLQNLLSSSACKCINDVTESCCGAIHYHNGDTQKAQTIMRHNIQRWTRWLDSDNSAIVIAASGCAHMIKQYANIFAHDSRYNESAQRVSKAVIDYSLLLEGSAIKKSENRFQRIAFHAPCTLQHGLHQAQSVEQLLQQAGYQLMEFDDSHMCCGSAGTYSILQPWFADSLRRRKIDTIMQSQPDCIATANIGCQLHLQSGTSLPVVHWIELIDTAN